MTNSTRKSISKLAVLFTTALLALVVALQFVYAPAIVPPATSSVANKADGANGSGVTFREADGEIADDFLLSDPTVKAQAASKVTPAPDKQVEVIVSLEGETMMDYAFANGMTVVKALSTAKGQSNLAKLETIRSSALNELSSYIIEHRYNYTTVLNAFSATVRYGDVEKIEKNKYVKEVIISDTYSMPQAVTENYVDVYGTGIFNSSGVGYDGTGVVVAVVDTGTDYTHEVFDMELDAETIAMTKDDVAAAVAYGLTATSLSAANGETIDEDDLYIKSKLPFAYDYADGDANVYPHESHGTHVAGIIAGKSDVITGVAPGAQVATFKVFSDYTHGAKTEWILAGLNDAVTLGVDVINMSLGTSCGFSREVDELAINEVYDKINAAGICLVVAASNDGSSAQGSRWGNTNLLSNPDSGTVGSPGSYTAALSVASVSGVKTKYFMAEGKEVYFGESRLVGKTDPNDFVGELLGNDTEGDFEYVVVPGIGLDINYQNVDVNGKIAVVKRGSNSFEDKVKTAAENGAIGVIVYNNVSGTISMSVGTKFRIPSCFVTMDYSAAMVAAGRGSIHLSTSYLAGPFMSDFSSWGCLPNLILAPDITAHGGEIYSAIAGGNKYDKLSGTSMAAPNLAGALILVCQYVKENNANAKTEAVRDESYGRMMSTATIVLNEEGNPYSPRKQGAGIADISHSITTDAYLSVDGSNKPKLSLGDDKNRTGEYTLNFNIVNTSGSAVSYDLGQYVMTESVSSDGVTVSEKAYMFTDTVNTYSAVARTGKAVINGKTVSVSGYGVAAVTVKIKLSADDKAYLNTYFKNGIFVEGYVLLKSNNANRIDLNIPYLAFYGDWTDAPMLDVTAYEVGASAVDTSVLPEEKLQADVYATLPYSGFYSSASDDGLGYYGMGAFCYIPAVGYTSPETQEKYAALTSNPNGDYLFYMVSAGLLRGAKRVDWEIRNSATGELVKSGVDYNARKSRANGGTQVGGYVMMELDMRTLDLPNNSKYTFSMVCYLDWTGEEGYQNTSGDQMSNMDKYVYGKKNTFSFEFTIDNEAPQLSNVAVRKVASGTSYDYFLDLTIYDNHYLQGYSLSTYSEKVYNDTYNRYEYNDSLSLTNGLVPVEGNYNADTVCSFPISGYWDLIQKNGGKLYLNMYDYAKNQTTLEIAIDEASVRKSDIQISKTSSAADAYTIAPTGQINLAQYLSIKASVDESLDPEDRTYIENYWVYDLVWESDDPSVVTVCSEGIQQGYATGVKEGTTTVSARTPNVSMETIEQWQAKVAELKEAGNTAEAAAWQAKIDNQYQTFTITVNANARVVKLTGIEMSVSAITLERGESKVISAQIYNYDGENEPTFRWTSTSPNVTVTPNGDGSATVYAVKSGTARISVNLVGTFISGYTGVRVLNEFEYSNNIYLRSYTGRGGDWVNENGETEHNVVVIPDDAGIYYISSAAFYGNEYIKKVIIPKGVTTVMRAAFLGCKNLEEVVMPETLETIDLAAFANCDNLSKINLDHVKSIGNSAFWGCKSLSSLKFEKCTYIDADAFAFCDGLVDVDLTGVGVVGGGAFFACNGLKNLVIPQGVFLDFNDSYEYAFRGGAFAFCSALETVTVYSDNIGKFSFVNCKNLKSVVFMNDVKEIDIYAFYYCRQLTNVSFMGKAYKIDDFAFRDCDSLRSIRLPAGLTILGYNVFFVSEDLEEPDTQGYLTQVTISSGATLDNVNVFALSGLKVSEFIVDDGHKYLSSQNGVLYDRDKIKLIAYPGGKSTTSFTVPSSVKTIGKSAFSGATLGSINLNNVEYIEDYAFYSFNGPNGSLYTTLTGNGLVKYVGDYAFFGAMVTTIQPVYANATYIGNYAFSACRTNVSTPPTLVIPANMEYIGDYAFAGQEVTLNGGNRAVISLFLGEVSFAGSSIKKVGVGAFSKSDYLAAVNLGSLTEISDSMFAGCEMLQAIVIPNTVTKIGEYAFDGCTKLANVTLSQNVKHISRSAFADTGLTSLTLPNSVVSIGARAFENSNISQVALNNVETVGAYAFANTAIATLSSDKLLSVGNAAFAECDSLTTVNLPSVTDIGIAAFEGCGVLNSLTISKIQNIGNRAFKDCASLASVDLATVKSIGSNAFDGVKLLTSVTLSGVEYIGSEAFAGTGITELSLPASLTEIEDKAFFGMDALQNINVAAANKVYRTPEGNEHKGVLYSVNDKGQYTLVCYPAARAGVSYTVYDYTIKLGAYAFSANKNLKNVTLPSYMQVIGVSAMSGMTSLEQLTIYAIDAPSLESYAHIEYLDDHGNVITGDKEENNGDNDDPSDGAIGDHDYDEELNEDELGIFDINRNFNYVNVYDNFNFAMDENDLGGEGKLRIIIPYNNTGYDNRIWSRYVGKCIESTMSIHVSVGTLEFIERIKAVIAQGANASAAEVEQINTVYNRLSSIQQKFVIGDYKYTDAVSGATIDEAFYTALLGGRNYINELNALQIGAKSSVNGYFVAGVETLASADVENGPFWGIIAALVCLLAIVLVAFIIDERRRSRK